MNPFVNPEFWLSLAFMLIIGLVFFSPVKKFLSHFFERQKKYVEDRIAQAHTVYTEALQGHKEALKSSKISPVNTQIQKELKAIRQEFSNKTALQIEAKKQDFQVRQTLFEQEIKNHLRQDLLNQVETKIKKQPSSKATEKEVQHFLKMLKENDQALRQSA